MRSTSNRNRGCLLVIMGTDGSGKSSVIDGLVPQLNAAPLTVHHFHFRPGLVNRLRKSGIPDNRSTDPHGLSAYNGLLSVAKLVFLWMDYTLGYMAKVHPCLRRKDLVIFDRYYHDLLVDPARYRYAGPVWLSRLLGKAIPTPDLWILLDAPPELVQSRKQELSADETMRQREAYLELLRSKENGVVIDAAQPLDAVIKEVTAQILDVAVRRSRQ